MKSLRCKTMVKAELKRLGIHSRALELGEIELKEDISGEELQTIDTALRNAGLELMYDKKHRLIDKISAVIYQMIYLSDDLPKNNPSSFISKAFNRDYTYLSNLFTEVKGVTIQKYIISQRIERVKDMLVYEDITLSDIAFKLKYSSVAHLSNQFRKITGFTPSSFKQAWMARHKIFTEPL